MLFFSKEYLVSGVRINHIENRCVREMEKAKGSTRQIP